MFKKPIRLVFLAIATYILISLGVIAGSKWGFSETSIFWGAFILVAVICTMIASVDPTKSRGLYYIGALALLMVPLGLLVWERQFSVGESMIIISGLTAMATTYRIRSAILHRGQIKHRGEEVEAIIDKSFP